MRGREGVGRIAKGGRVLKTCLLTYVDRISGFEKEAEICKEEKWKESSVGVLGDSWVWAGREGCGVGCKLCSFEVETMRERRRRR